MKTQTNTTRQDFTHFHCRKEEKIQLNKVWGLMSDRRSLMWDLSLYTSAPHFAHAWRVCRGTRENSIHEVQIRVPRANSLILVCCSEHRVLTAPGTHEMGRTHSSPFVEHVVSTGICDANLLLGILSMNKSRVGMKAAAFAKASLVLGGLARRRAELPEGVLCEQLGECFAPSHLTPHTALASQLCMLQVFSPSPCTQPLAFALQICV